MRKLRQLVDITHNLGTEVSLEHSFDQAHILVISNTTTVVDQGNQVIKRLIGHLRLLV
jgi:hypothetical protein